MWPEDSLLKELRHTPRGRFGDAWRDKETRESLATEIRFSTNCGFRQRLEEHCCWGPFSDKQASQRWCTEVLSSWCTHSPSGSCRKARHRNNTSRRTEYHMLHGWGDRATGTERICWGGHLIMGGNQELQDEGGSNHTTSSSSPSPSTLPLPFLLPSPSSFPPPPFPSFLLLSLSCPSSPFSSSLLLFLCRCKCAHS